MKTNTLRIICIIWCFFIGLGAVYGATCMFVDPTGETTGMSGLLPGFQALPFADTLFQDLVFPGIALLIVNGLTQLLTAVLLIRRAPRSARCFIGCGVVLMLWICIQFVIYPLNPLSVSYFLFGLAEAVCGWALAWKERQA